MDTFPTKKLYPVIIITSVAIACDIGPESWVTMLQITLDTTSLLPLLDFRASAGSTNKSMQHSIKQNIAILLIPSFLPSKDLRGFYSKIIKSLLIHLDKKEISYHLTAGLKERSFSKSNTRGKQEHITNPLERTIMVLLLTPL
ncbi:lipoprotein, putative [Neorickettsia risticii str. Illinois]|uniref:Lipoprotein, putative n=1 Tax=Neorickettsia risticii (strain Illinois) TaxID=434131 RepID=C6V5P7_NEORI|nr:lipoprotein, putative [Neorickettsia risticii str. Illinois]